MTTGKFYIEAKKEKLTLDDLKDMLKTVSILNRVQKGSQATTNALVVLGTAIESVLAFRVSGWLSLHNMQAGDMFLVVEEVRDQDDITYREHARNVYVGVQVSPIVHLTAKPCQGWRIRVQRTAGVDRAVTYQYFTEVKSA